MNFYYDITTFFKKKIFTAEHKVDVFRTNTCLERNTQNLITKYSKTKKIPVLDLKPDLSSAVLHSILVNPQICTSCPTSHISPLNICAYFCNMFHQYATFIDIHDLRLQL
jgi:hypothetical protein